VRDPIAGVPAGPEPGIAVRRSGTGALYALSWEFPELADEDGAWWSAVRGLDVRDEGFPWPPGSAEEARVREIVAVNEELLASIRSAAALPPGGARGVLRRATRPGGDPFSTEIPDVLALRAAITLLAYEAYLAQHRDAPSEGLESASSALGFARHLEDLPWLVSIAHRALLTEIALAPLEQVGLSGSTDRSLSRADAALGGAMLAPSLSFGVEMEIRSTLWAFDLIRTRPVSDVAAVLADSPFALSTLGWVAYGRGPFRFLGSRDQTLYVGIMTDFLEAVRQPYHEALPDLERIDREAEAYLTWRHPMLVWAIPSVLGTAERTVQVDARLALARIRVALERCRRARRTYPRGLEELSPAWLEGVPVHAPTGKPFRYARDGDGYVLGVPSDTPVDRDRPGAGADGRVPLVEHP
jgi:hypothetical protein